MKGQGPSDEFSSERKLHCKGPEPSGPGVPKERRPSGEEKLMLNRIADLWCRRMHTEAMWPIHGKYICKRCLREHALEWEGPPTAAEYGCGLPPQTPRVELDSRVWLAGQQ